MIRALRGLCSTAGVRRFDLLLFATIVLGALEGVAFIMLGPVLSALFRDDHAALFHWLTMLALVGAVHAATLVVVTQTGARVAVGMLRTIYERVGAQLTRLPLGWFSDDRVGQITQVTGKGTMEIAGVSRHLLRPVVCGIVTPLTIAIGMVAMDWRVGLTLLLSIPLVLLAAKGINDRVARADDVAESRAAVANAVVIEFAQQQAVLRAYGRTAHGHRQLDEALSDQAQALRRLLMNGAIGFGTFLAVLQLVLTAAIVEGVFLMSGHDLAPSTGICLLVLSVRFAEPFAHAADLAASIRLAEKSEGRVNLLLGTPVLPEPSVVASTDGGDIRFEQVDFGYRPDHPVLRKLSFDIPARSITAVVGPSGSGKTTLLRLIARFLDVDSGQIRIGDVDLRDLGSDDVLRRIAFVFQHVYLFEASILDNVRAGRPDASMAEIEAVARLARVDEIVARLPDGWDSQVGEGGMTLSGGERQRISIARALLKDAPILLLDEATAALDAENQAIIQRAVAGLARSKTVVIVAHRLETVREADQVLVMDDGVLTAHGRHEDLLRTSSIYKQFWSCRERSKGWRLAADTTPPPLL